MSTTSSNGVCNVTDEDLDQLYAFWPGTQPAPAPLPEAPVSITLKATLHGHEVLVTLRGHDFASVKAQVEQASQWLQSQAPATGEGWCSKHSVQMKLTDKNGQRWWSHRLADGSWCKGR
jgi:hypothetical protein